MFKYKQPTIHRKIIPIRANTRPGTHSPPHYKMTTRQCEVLAEYYIRDIWQWYE